LNTANKIPQRLGECKLYKGITNYAYNKYWGVQIIYIISTGEYKYRGVLIIYYTGTRRNIHSLTPIMVINHPLSASSIYYDP